MKRRHFLAAAVAATGLGAVSRRAVAAPTRGAADPCLIERWSWAMGQPVHLRLFHDCESDGFEAAEVAFQELWRVESRLSRFDDASDLSELNRHAGKGSMRVAPDLLAVLRAAARFRSSTGGAFDVAVEPLMRTWGFREPRKAPPSQRELLEAREAVRQAVIRIDAERIELPVSTTAVDLGGIGVGYGLDCAARVLRDRGTRAALLEVSGDFIAIGAPPGKAGWPIDIVDPRGHGRVAASTEIRDEALATSANTRSVVHLGRVICGHVMDPIRGEPADRVIQATVVAGTALGADALSTAMLAAGSALPGVQRSWVFA
jgi:thiamine biosynthesis lipoprotein